MQPLEKKIKLYWNQTQRLITGELRYAYIVLSSCYLIFINSFHRVNMMFIHSDLSKILSFTPFIAPVWWMWIKSVAKCLSAVYLSIFSPLSYFRKITVWGDNIAVFPSKFSILLKPVLLTMFIGHISLATVLVIPVYLCELGGHIVFL